MSEAEGSEGNAGAMTQLHCEFLVYPMALPYIRPAGEIAPLLAVTIYCPRHDDADDEPSYTGQNAPNFEFICEYIIAGALLLPSWQ